MFGRYIGVTRYDHKCGYRRYKWYLQVGSHYDSFMTKENAIKALNKMLTNIEKLQEELVADKLSKCTSRDVKCLLELYNDDSAQIPKTVLKKFERLGLVSYDLRKKEPFITNNGLLIIDKVQKSEATRSAYQETIEELHADRDHIADVRIKMEQLFENETIDAKSTMYKAFIALCEKTDDQYEKKIRQLEEQLYGGGKK